MVGSTGRLHGFESIAEQRLLLALDFLGVTQLPGQPMTLRFTTTGGGTAEHVPDFLAVTPSGVVLFDVRPAERIGDRDRVKFAATAEAALSAGWGSPVVAAAPGQATLDALSAQRAGCRTDWASSASSWTRPAARCRSATWSGGPHTR